MRSSHSQSCRKGHHITSRTKRRGEKTIWVSPVTLGGCCGKRQLSSPWKYPSPVGRSARTDRELQWLRGECGRKKRGRQRRQPWLPCCPSQPEMTTCWCGQPWGLNFRLQPTDPRKRTWLGYEETDWRAWNMEPHLGMCKGWGPDRQQKPHCQQVQKEGVPLHTSLTLSMQTVGTALPLQSLATACTQQQGRNLSRFLAGA